jgi:hypothetical protein
MCVHQQQFTHLKDPPWSSGSLLAPSSWCPSLDDANGLGNGDCGGYCVLGELKNEL